jgi:DNA-directed RNA polymerase specialized sigma24 family protein
VNVTYSRAGRDDLAILFAEGAIGRFSDAELLRRFASDPRDAVSEVAFAALVDRHGPMVLGVCRRVTGDRHAADDAFQAVFLILARKAQTVRLGADDSLGRWLYRVSVRVARRARAEGERRRRMAGDFDGLVAVLESTSRAAVPAGTAKRAVAAVARISADGALAAASPSAVTGLAGFYLRSMMMKQIGIIVAFVAIAIPSHWGKATFGAIRASRLRRCGATGFRPFATGSAGFRIADAITRPIISPRQPAASCRSAGRHRIAPRSADRPMARSRPLLGPGRR